MSAILMTTFAAPLTDDILDQVLAIEQVSFPEPWSRKLFEQEINHPASEFIVMLDGDKVIGYGGFWCVLDEAHITNVAILPELRRRGLGSRVLGRLLEMAREKGMRRATLEVRESNLAGISLYRKFGFEPVAIQANYYAKTNEDALIMWKNGLDEKSTK